MGENFLCVLFRNQQVNSAVLRNVVKLMLIPALGLFSLLPPGDLFLFFRDYSTVILGLCQTLGMKPRVLQTGFSSQG